MEWNGIEKRFNAKHCFYHNLVGCIIFSRTWQTFRCVVVFSSKSFHSSIKFPDNAHIFQCYCNHKLKYCCSQQIQWHCMCSDSVSCSMSNFLFEFFSRRFCLSCNLILPQWSVKLNLINASLCICQNENYGNNRIVSFHILGNISIPSECKHGVKLDSNFVVVI